MLSVMSLTVSVPARRRRRWWVVQGVAAVAVAIGGILMFGRWPGLAVWVLLAGVTGIHIAGRHVSDCGILAALEGVDIAQLAVMPARVRPRSDTPVADIARIRAAGCGIVAVDGVDRVLPAGRVDRFEMDVLLAGHWQHLGLAAAELDGSEPVDRLARLPNEDEIWLVRTAVTTLALGSTQLRAAVGRPSVGDLRRDGSAPPPSAGVRQIDRRPESRASR